MQLFPGIKKKKFILNVIFFFSAYNLFSQTLIINEVSNGPSGNKEYIELVVVDTAAFYNCGTSTPPCIDIRGWIIDDNSGYHGAGGVAAGANRFSQNALWSCVPLGTIILIYNDADVNANIPPVDIALNDGNCNITAPISNTSLFETNTTTPGAIACSYPPVGWTPGGDWASTLLANSGDCARIVDLNGCEVFSLCWASCSTSTQIYFSSGMSGTDNVWYFNDSDASLQVNWSEGCTDPSSCGTNEQTPGAPNNILNQNFIAQFNNNCLPITPISISTTSTDAGCVCDGTAEANASGSIPGYTYEWYDNAFTTSVGSSFSVGSLCAGTYHVIATSSIGCVDTATVVIVSSGSAPIAIPTSNSPICEGETITLFANTISGATYQWSGPGGYSSTDQNPVIPVSTLGDEGNYTLIIQTGACSSVPVDIFIDVLPLPVANISSNSPVCTGDTIRLFSNSISNGTYQWNGPNGFSSPNQDPEITNASLSNEGLYVLTIDSGSCSSLPVNIFVDIIELPVISVSSNSPVCIGDDIELVAVSAGANSFEWSGPDNFTSVISNPILTVADINNSGAYTVIVTSGGCVDSAQITVLVTNPTNAVIDSVLPICSEMTPFNFTASPAGGTWSGTGITNSSAGTFNPGVSGAGIFQIIYSFGNGCIANDTISIIVNAPPIANAGTDESIFCSFSTMGLDGSNSSGNSITYSWTEVFGNIVAGSQTSNPVISTPGIYVVMVTDINGCSDIDTVEISFTPGPSASFFSNPNSGYVPFNITLQNNSTGSSLTYDWTTCEGETSSAIQPLFTIDSAGNCVIQLIVTDQNNCTDTAIQYITAYNPYSYFVPNVFTPNQDGQNDTFQIITNGIDAAHLTIYNRWGQFLYETSTLPLFWSGEFQNETVPEGTYYYLLDLTLPDGSLEKLNGYITLLRQ